MTGPNNLSNRSGISLAFIVNLDGFGAVCARLIRALGAWLGACLLTWRKL